MAAQSDTTALMAKRKKPNDVHSVPEVEPASKPRPGYPVFARVPDEVGAALEAFMRAQRFPPEKAEIVEAALRDFLEREGFLKSKKEGGSK